MLPHAMILGATSDIAQAIAARMAQHGYGLTLAARQVTRLKDFQADLTVRHKTEVILQDFDATRITQHDNWYTSLPTKPDVAIICFGSLGEQENAFKSCQAMEDIITTNYTGAVSIGNVIAADFAARGQGTLVFISSVAGDRGRQSNFIYGSAKAGLSAYAGGLRQYLYPHGVHVMLVKPGFVATKMTENLKLPTRLVATPEHVAKDICRGILRKKDVVYTPWFWRIIMGIITRIPEAFFKKLKL